jgi:hypothetical protein
MGSFLAVAFFVSFGGITASCGQQEKISLVDRYPFNIGIILSDQDPDRIHQSLPIRIQMCTVSISTKCKEKLPGYFPENLDILYSIYSILYRTYKNCIRYVILFSRKFQLLSKALKINATYDTDEKEKQCKPALL